MRTAIFIIGIVCFVIYYNLPEKRRFRKLIKKTKQDIKDILDQLSALTEKK